jgi:hypothetical protein
MALSKLINRWSETITIQIASDSSKYNQCTYTNSTIVGRLVQSTSKEAIMWDKYGEKITSDGKLFTLANLKIGDKAGGYKIVYKKECKDKNNVLQFYKYYLSRDSIKV